MPLLIGLIAALLLAAFLYYSIRVEPHHIEITRHEIALPCLPPELDGITLCQVSDMHISRPARNTKAIFEALREVKADLYLFTGDQVRFRGGMEEFLGLLPELKTLVEPAFLVLGNSEH